MSLHALRISEGQDLKQAIADFVRLEKLSACAIVSGVGGLSKARIRMPGAAHTDDGVREFTGPFEIVSLIGIPNGSMHLHIAISDKEGNVIGGHMKDGCIVRMTAEIVLVSDENLTFTREVDPKTGFDELVVEKRKSSHGN